MFFFVYNWGASHCIYSYIYISQSHFTLLAMALDLYSAPAKAGRKVLSTPDLLRPKIHAVVTWISADFPDVHLEDLMCDLRCFKAGGELWVCYGCFMGVLWVLYGCFMGNAWELMRFWSEYVLKAGLNYTM